MAEAPVRRLRADARHNRERVLDAAEALFAELGLQAQTDDIAVRAGVGVGTVYRHFPTKRELVEAVIVRRTEALLAAVRAAIDDPDPGQAFRSIFARGAELLGGNRALAEDVARGMNVPALPPGIKEELFGAMSALAARAQAAGQLRPDLCPADVLMLVACVAHSVDVAQQFDPCMRRRFLALVLDGLRPGASTPLPGRRLDLDDLRRLAKQHAAG